MRYYLYLFIAIPFISFSQIQVNEIFADNGACCLDDSLETEDFVEIINTGPAPVNIAGYFFGDGNGGSIIPSGYPELTTVSSGQVLLLWFDNDPEQGPLHIDAKLNNDGEVVLCLNEDGDTIINVSFPAQIEDVSYSAFPDGAPYSLGWDLTMCPTPGEFNEPCPLVEGCTSVNAYNYNQDATVDDGSCMFDDISGLIINEYSAANCNPDGSDCGDYEDWIELYNNSNNSIDLAGYFLSDKIDNITKWQFSSSTVIEPDSYLIVYASGLDPTLDISNTNTSFKLTQTKSSEYIVLTDSSEQIVDYKKIDRHQLTHSWGRNGESEWRVYESPTPGYNNTSSTGYNSYVPVPTFDVQSGFFNNSVDLSLSSNDSEVDIYYTLDGSFPDANSNYYTAPISINNTTVVRAVAISQNSNFLSSFSETNTYFINDNHSLYVVSIAGDEVDELINGDYGNRPIGSFEIFDQNGDLIDEAVGEFNKHGNDSWAYGQRGLDYITRDQYGYNYAINDKLFTIKNRDSFQRLILKAAANDNYPFTFGSPAHIRDSYCHSLSQVGDLRMDERSHESCILYVNGEYWGVYDVREKVDDLDFLEHYYDQGEGYVDFLKTWGNTWVEFGNNATNNEWDNLVDFITSNDMSDADNYDYVKSVYNTGSLIDYFILNSYVVAMDWLNWNTGWWRGRNPDGDKKKWRYILWDMDATFDHYVNYTGVPDTSSDADPCDPEELGDPGGQGHVPILNALFDNPDFEASYINRYADLSNTIFSCDFMISHLDSLITIIDPEMPRQIERWGGDYSEWQENVQELRDFILDRCSDEFVEGMEDCYDVEAVDLTVIIEGQGEVSINTIDIETLDSPWTGIYYSGLPVELEASSNSDELFNFYWEVIDGDVVLDDPTDPNLVFDINGPVTIVAYFDACASVPTTDIVGPTAVEGGSIWQYTFPSEFTNTSEWSVSGGEVLFTSSSENTIGIQWNYGTGEGQIVLTQFNTLGELECLFVNIVIEEVAPTSTTELDYTENLIVFPSPASTGLKIYTDAKVLQSISLFDMASKKVFSCVNADINTDGAFTIDVSSFNTGIYFLSVQTEIGVFVEKVSISR